MGLHGELAYCSGQIECANPSDKTKKIRFVKVVMADLTGNLYALVYINALTPNLRNCQTHANS